MDCLIVSCVYPPEPVVSSQTSATLGGGLASAGHTVRVVAPYPNRPQGKRYMGYTRGFVKREQEHGMLVYRVRSAVSRTASVASRGWENLSFGVATALMLLGLRRPDILYLNTWPLIATGLAAAIARWRKIPYVLSIQDLYPESLYATHDHQGGTWFERLRAIDATIARGAASVIVISERFAQAYRERGVPEHRLHVVPNWVAPHRPSSPKAASDLRKTLDISDDHFLFAYGGNIGKAAGVDRIVAAFRATDDATTALCIAGSGSELGRCQAVSEDDTRIRFRTPWPPEETQPLLSAADVLVLPTAEGQSLSSVPSKLIAYMLSGRPVLALVDARSDTADVIRTAGCGWIVDASAPHTIADAFRHARNTSAEARAGMGEAGKQYALKHFSAETSVPAVISILDQARLTRNDSPKQR